MNNNLLNIFLYAPDDFKNLCVIARSLECFGFNKCHIYDPHHIVREKYGKSYSSRIRTVSAGAFNLIQWEVITDPIEFIGTYSSRRIAIVPIRNSTPLFQFIFLPSDLIIFGSERNGIPSNILTNCDAFITIPIVGVTQSLNLSVAVSIVLAEISR